jgi:hypothetical protein
MRAPPGDRGVTEPVSHENLGQAGGIANYDQGDSHAHGHHGHAYGRGLDHHGHADTDAHYVNSDGDAYVNTHADTGPVSRRYGG